MVSIVIVNYKSKGLLKNCIKSIYDKTRDLDYEIVVVDNNSEDGSEQMVIKRFPTVKFIQSGANLGFGAGANLGIDNTKGDYVTIINPDIVLMENSFKKLYDFAEKNPKIGLLAPQLINPDGTIQHTRCRFPEFLMPAYRRTFLKKIKFIKNKIFRYLTLDKDYNEIGKTDWIFGAVLFMRKEAFLNVGKFDERFFLGFEDTDLCRKLWNSGYQVWYYPKTRVIHYPHRFSQKKIFNKSVQAHITSWLKYFKKYGLKKIKNQI